MARTLTEEIRIILWYKNATLDEICLALPTITDRMAVQGVLDQMERHCEIWRGYNVPSIYHLSRPEA
jgi:hypothetical protein